MLGLVICVSYSFGEGDMNTEQGAIGSLAT